MEIPTTSASGSSSEQIVAVFIQPGNVQDRGSVSSRAGLQGRGSQHAESFSIFGQAAREWESRPFALRSRLCDRISPVVKSYAGRLLVVARTYHTNQKIRGDQGG